MIYGKLLIVVNLGNGGSALYNVTMTLIIIVSILIIIATLMQPQKQQDALNALSGGAVFSGQSKKRGFEALMERITCRTAF